MPALSENRNSRIAPSLHADGNLDAYLASIHESVLPKCLPFATGGRVAFTPGTYGDVTFGTFPGAAGKNIAYGAFKATDSHDAAAKTLLDELVRWAEALRTMRG